jgi:capsular polysaccharide export protein
MISQGTEAFAGKRVLLLQGPIGPFFARLATDLRHAGATVFKVNFNAGDWLFYRRNAMNYRGTMEDWPLWLEQQLSALKIDVVMLFGDCRPVHMTAHAVATRLGLDVGVFEEGYVRPDYITLERFGVNGNSRMPRTPQAYTQPAPPLPDKQSIAMPYWYMVWFGFCYFTVGGLGKPFFPHYQHHRPLTIWEMFPWLRSVWRKQWYRLKERGLQKRLTGSLSKRYFFVPLQVYNDAQITMHADLDGVEDFIEMVLRSFACHAPEDDWLVLKHHPMDRGYRDYTRLIKRLSKALQIEDRVLYGHDQYTPALLDHAKGVVVINSTVGLSALAHHCPTMVCGEAIYDIPGLTFQGSLDAFWTDGLQHPPVQDLYKRFRDHLIARTQLNGNFYRPLRLPGSQTGLVWCKPTHVRQYASR